MFRNAFLLISVLALTSCQVKKGGAAGGILAPPTNTYSTTISATTNKIADNLDSSVVTITVLDNSVPVVGAVPTFSVTGTANFMGPCSATDATGTSTCSLKSTKAEAKTLKVVAPHASATTTSVTFLSGPASATTSTITSTGPVIANGVATNIINLTLKDAFGNPVAGIVPTFTATNPGGSNVYNACPATNAAGLSICSMTSLRAGIKTLQITAPVAVTGGPAFFWSGPAVAANSIISGTTPHNADGVDASVITVNLFDANMNPVAGVVPTFNATGSSNTYSVCSQSNVSGTSNCTLKTTEGGVKIVSLVSPFAKTGNAITFNAVIGSVDPANSSITASSPHVADGVDSATVTITLKDSANNGVPGLVPTFLATDTNASNAYGVCSATDAGGVSTCTLKSTKAELKNLLLTTPIVKAGGSTTFVPGIASSVTSTIIGSTPVVADGVATSTISVYIADAFNNAISGSTPTFSATDTGFQNIYGACSVTSASGLSSCTLASTFAETKILMLLTPISVIGGNVVFVAGAAVAANSNITGTSPVIADGTASSTVTIVLRDINNNPVAAQTPTFTATDTGTNNAYGVCSATNASGSSTCTLKSNTAETKTLSIATPVVKADGTVIFTPAGASVANSSITGSSPVVADGVATSTVTITLKDSGNNPIPGLTPTFSATDTGTTNAYGACSVTDASGISTCTLTSTKAETKTLSITGPITKLDGTVTFIPGVVAAATSVISGTTPVVADGVATSTVTITLLDAFNNPVSAEIPTFSATDTGSTNNYGICSASNASGVSTCTLSSLKAESKTLSIATPVVKAGGNVIFTAGAAVAANSHITGTTPVVADGLASSTITITLADINNNPVAGSLPVFGATDTGSSNSYGVCSLSDATGTSTCTLSSTNAETKILSLISPVIDTGDSVVFTAAGASVANSTISGTTPVVADGVDTSTVTITLKDANNNSVVGITPTFSATDTGSTNTYGSCSATNASGVSTCTLSSLKAEGKTLSIATPVIKAGSVIVFTAGVPVAANSSINGTSPVVADGTATSTVTVNLKDINNNPVSGQVPTFSATDTGTTNSYGVCSASNASGDSTCSLSSNTAEIKTLAIVTPVVKTGGTVTFTAGAPVAANSSITGTTPVVADGVATSTVTITLKDINNNEVAGVTPTFSATDTGSANAYGSCSASDAAGVSTCTLSSTVAEVKTLSIATPFIKAGSNVTFTPGGPSVANSSITGTTPVVADGTTTSTITITIKDASNNPISGTTPTFSATDTGSVNVYGVCSATNASGISTCTLSSTKAEVKTLSLTSPVSKAGSNVTFIPDSPFAATSTITGTSPVVADGVATSTVTVTILDANSNPISGQTPTFSATDSGSGNNYGSCSATNASGVSTCTLSSNVAEVKTLSIATPVVKADGTVTFTAGSAVAVNSTITGTSPVLADGSATSTVTITLKDASNNPVPGQTPTFSATDTGSGNNYGICSASDASGISTCTLNSTYAEVKTLSIATPFVKAGGTVTFTPGSPVAANSTITGTTPIVADGSATSTVTITLKDANNNPVSGQTPTFSATDTGTTNVYNACSASNASGVSTCTLSSLKAETKTLSIATPVVKAGGNVVFTAGTPVAANSSISGTTPVVADGSATSTVTITLIDVNSNPVSGIVPTFGATDTSSTNAYGVCSSSNSSGISTCTLSSTYAETKTLSIATPVVKSGTNVVFTSAGASVANSTISGTSPVTADGVATSTVTITLKDANNNSVVGTIPTFSATDTGTTNSNSVCTATNASGISTCTLSSLKAEIKTLSIATPIVKAGGTVTFTAGSPVAANSTISGTTPIVADGSATSTITITLNDVNNNPVSGQTPTFSATDTGSTNIYNACSASNASGVSTCTLSSLKAETKTLSIATPVVKAGGNVVFTAGAAVAANSTITGTSPVVANGSSTSTITITLMDVNSNPVSGQTPTFTATNTGTTNANGVCSASNASGVSTCTLSSSYAEIKTLAIATPVVKTGGTVTFTAGSAVAANSTITGTSPVVADGTATSTVTITLKDVSNNPVSGIVPTFGATNTGTTNVYGTCSASDASGISTCTLTSTKAEVKTLSIATPVVKAGGTVTFTAGAAVAANSTITGTSPVVADGTATSTVTITLLDASSNPVAGQTPTFSATDTGTTNVYTACSASNTSGVSTCTLKSTKAEVKTLSIATPVVKAGGTVTFNAGSAVAANSTITGTGPVVADGTSTSTITITLLDAFSNPVSGQTPTFTATNTGTSNVNGACSASNASGVSTCTLKSANAEVKTLAIATPVVKTGGTVTFTAGSAVAANSSISGTGPVIANGSATSTVTILLKDAANNPVAGITPTFSATDTGAGNTYQACSATDATGTSTCTMRSTKAEVKTLSIATPVVKAGTTVTFTAGTAVAANSTITGTGPVVADGTATSTVTVTLKDVNSNNVSGITPVFTSTGTGNTIGACGVTDATGAATCTLKSTRAQVKTLSISSPFVKAGGTVTFIAGSPSATTTIITGTTPVSADGVSTSFISITILDVNSNPISGTIPIFNATNTNTTNVYGACSASDVAGLSMCTLASTKAEFKTLQLTSPVGVTGDIVEFSSSLPTSANSSIVGTGPVLADGTTDSTVTITLRDGNNNPVPGIEPGFDGTDTGSGNTYDTCSLSDAGGVSVCTMQSTVAEVKTLRITSPVTKTGGTVTFTAGSPAAATSTITGTSPVIADNTAISTITITLKDINGNNVGGQTPTFTSSGTGNTSTACSVTNASGVSTCTLKSTKAEVKNLSIATPVTKTGGTVTFTAGTAVAANSTITGTGPTNPDGTSQSTITITLKDVNNNLVAGITPTFSATGTNNTYNACSSSNASGVSTCTMTSTTAETKTLSIATPFVKAGGTVVFASGSPSVANSSITASGPVIANGVATSTVTITLKDNTNAAVINVTPTFSADGTSNTYNACSITNASGVSTCTMTSTKAESKIVSIATPIVKAGSSVVFNPGPASATTSTITCDMDTYKADGTDTCNIAVTILDAFNNARAGDTPTISVSGTSNTVSSCTVTDGTGESNCTLKSTKAEGKYLSIVTPVAVSNTTEYPFYPNGIDIQVPIEMLDRGIIGTTSVVTFLRSRTSLDTTKYVADDIQYFLEVTAANTNTSAYQISLVDELNVVVPGTSFSVPGSTTAATRMRWAFDPLVGAHNYRIRTPITTASTLRIHSARIIVQMTKAVEAELYIPMGGADAANDVLNDTGSTAQIMAATTATYTNIPTTGNFTQFVRNDSLYDTIPVTNGWTLEAIMSSSATTTAQTSLFDKGNNQQIPESVAAVTSATVTMARTSFSSNATNFNNGDNLEVRFRSATAVTTRLYKVGLWVRVRYVKKAEVFWRLTTHRRATTGTTLTNLPDGRFLYEAAQYSNPSTFFLAMGSSSAANASTVRLVDMNTSDNAVTGGTVISTVQSVTTYGGITNAVTLTSGDRYYVSHQRGASGTAVIGGAFILIRCQE
ncbi:MAG: Ig-like domain-containing protein [Bdellovibrionota bacterium]